MIEHVRVEEIIEKLEIRQLRLISLLPEKKRPIYSELEKKFTDRAILLYGARGTGKTTFLLFMAKKHGFLYLSGDDPIVSSVHFYELAEKILVHYPGVIIDEVHFLKDWSLVVKYLYDSFPNRKIWISDSSSVVLRKGIADLSRRVVKIRMPLMSFREYVYFETGKLLDICKNPFENPFEYASKVLREIDPLLLFKTYREGGTRPFYQEGSFRERMQNILEKTIYYDIPHLVGNISENHLGVMKAIIGHLLLSKTPTVNIENMSREWGVGKQKIYALLNAMEEVGFLNIVRKEGKSKAQSKGAKIFFADPGFYYVLDGDVGNYREAFVVFSLKEKGKVLAAKNEKEADLIFNGLKLEIGGKKKSSKSADFVIRDDIDVPARNSIPLWMLGMLW